MPLSGPVRLAVLAAATAIPVIVVVSLGPIPQPEAYHAFADTRTWAGVPNFQNVVTNVPFLFVGMAGLAALRRGIEGGLAYGVFFAAVLCVAPGSAWYHLEPTTERLFWDRLPMAVAFGSFAAVLVGDRIDRRLARALLAPLVLGAVASVIAWRISEERGHGDVRAYLLAQTLTMVWTVVVVAVFPGRPGETRIVVLVAAWYGVAKLLETFDAQVFHATGGLVSGHALKHLAAAAGTWQVVRLVRERAVTPSSAAARGDTVRAT